MTLSHGSYSKQDKWQKWRKDVLRYTLSSFSAHLLLYVMLLTVMNNRSIHAQQDGLVELAIQSSLAGFEPNTTVEISSAQVTAVHLPSTRPSLCSVYKSGEDVTTTLVSSEVDERQSIGRLAASLRVQKREASAAAARIYHSTGEKVQCQAQLTFEARGDLLRHTHTDGNRAETQDVFRREIPQVTGYELNGKKFEITEDSEKTKQPKEKTQLYQDSLERNIIRDYLSRSKGIRYCPTHDRRWICRS